MTKLAKNYYRTAKGEKKLNCFSVNIPKELVNKTNIKEEDNIKVSVKGNKIIIEKE